MALIRNAHAPAPIVLVHFHSADIFSLTMELENFPDATILGEREIYSGFNVWGVSTIKLFVSVILPDAEEKCKTACANIVFGSF